MKKKYQEYCKECRRELRANGSSRCKTCSNKFKVAEFGMERLERKVEEARKEQGINI